MTGYQSKKAMARDKLAQPAQEPDIAALVTGMEVSIDVSTGDHDSGNRLFGVVDLVQQSQGSKHGLILLVQETKANFKEALAQPAQEPVVTIAVREHAPVGKVAYVLEVNLPVGIHNLYTTPPQRPWVGLTDQEAQLIYDMGRTPTGMMEMVEALLKGKNT